ncbi:MAG: DUF2156 domain-containing protein, partial [Planctomycetota bacterium]
LALEDREFVDDAFRRLGRECSEFTFAAYYLFRCPARPSLSVLDGALLFREKCRGGGWCLLPPMLTDDVAGVAEKALRGLAGTDQAPHHLAAVTDRVWEEHFAPTGRFERRPDRDNWDYVYEREKLARVRGRAFHSQKNQINRFTRNHEWEYRRLTRDLVEGARDLADRWCEERCAVSGPMSYDETRALKEGLCMADQLGLVGGVIIVGGRVEALAVGEKLTEDTVAVHFEKAHPGVNGLAQLINREFALREVTCCRWFNREQDLGDPGLRQAKERYNPSHMVEKNVVALKGDPSLDQHFDYVYTHRKESGI